MKIKSQLDYNYNIIRISYRENLSLLRNKDDIEKKFEL